MYINEIINTEYILRTNYKYSENKIRPAILCIMRIYFRVDLMYRWVVFYEYNNQFEYSSTKIVAIQREF